MYEHHRQIKFLQSESFNFEMDIKYPKLFKNKRAGKNSISPRKKYSLYFNGQGMIRAVFFSKILLSLSMLCSLAFLCLITQFHAFFFNNIIFKLKKKTRKIEMTKADWNSIFNLKIISNVPLGAVNFSISRNRRVFFFSLVDFCSALVILHRLSEQRFTRKLSEAAILLID